MKLFAARISACAVCVACFGVGSDASGDELSIRQQVQEDGSFERIIVSTDSQMQLSDLVGQADLVVEASTAGGTSFLGKGETHIYTDYPFSVLAIIKNHRRPDLLVGDAVTVRRESGFVQVDGRPAVTTENDFPSFAARETYTLFLKQSSDNVYTVLGGPQGAWPPGSRDRSMAEVRALSKFVE